MVRGLSERGTDHNQIIDEVLAAKREGTRILEALTQAYRLDAFVCFSSIAGVWGAGRQAAYAAANAFLDAWAQSARAGGLPAIAVAWGPWAGEGMINDAARAHLTRSGLRSLPPEQALQALEQALAQDAAHVVVADVDWAVFRESFEAWGARPVLSALASPPGPPANRARSSPR